MSRLAILGGEPAFPDGIPLVRPPTPPLEQVVRRMAPSYESGRLTNGPLVRQFEERVADRLGVRHAVAVATCTSGLMLVLRALAPDGPVLLPSFTFSASGHAAMWNGLEPVFAECDPRSFQLDVADAGARATGIGCVLGTHVFGAPCAVEAIEQLAEARRVPVMFDAAHAFGATRGDRPVGGFGAAEVFSLSPSKVMIAGEGGLVTTNRDEVAASVRIGLDYGNPGDYDTRFVGLNARMSELHAALALESLTELDDHLEVRRKLARRYVELLDAVPGVRTQLVDDGDESTWKDFTIAVDGDEYGVSRDRLVEALAAEGVDTRRYFDPPLHRQTAYANVRHAPLPVTEQVSASVVSLPLFRSLADATVERIVEIMATVHDHAAEVAAAD